MVCKNCGCEIEKGWKYCPNCSRNLNLKRNLIIVGSIISIIIIFIIIFVANINAPISEKDIEKYLENKYNEDFEDIQFIKSVENPDNELNCDGSSLLTIKGRGSTEFFKAYSKENDIEFHVYYDTDSFERKLFSKDIDDNYDELLEARTIEVNAYNNFIELVNKYFDNESIDFEYYLDEAKVESSDEIYNLLSKYDASIGTLHFGEGYVYINDDIFNYCKNNYEKINNLNNDLAAINKENPFDFYLIFKNDANVTLCRIDDEAYVYDSGKVWGERLEEFVKRENY